MDPAAQGQICADGFNGGCCSAVALDLSEGEIGTYMHCLIKWQLRRVAPLC